MSLGFVVLPRYAEIVRRPSLRSDRWAGPADLTAYRLPLCYPHPLFKSP